MTAAYPNREHRNANTAARRRAIKALGLIEADARALAHKLGTDGTFYVDASTAGGLHEQAAKVTASFAVLETLREVREWDAAGEAEEEAKPEGRLQAESRAVQDIVRFQRRQERDRAEAAVASTPPRHAHDGYVMHPVSDSHENVDRANGDVRAPGGRFAASPAGQRSCAVCGAGDTALEKNHRRGSAWYGKDQCADARGCLERVLATREER